jgi:O-antigen biosynthesis protein
MEFTGERYLPTESGRVRLEHLQRYSLVAQIIEGKDVLDLACGEGYGSYSMASKARSVTGVDVSSEAVAHARSRYPSENLKFLEGSATRLDIPNAAFDVVVSFETIEHLLEQEKMLSEIRRVLKPLGVLVISSPNRPIYSEESGEVNEFHVKELDFIEFDSLLAREFPSVQYYGQRLVMAMMAQPLNCAAESAELLVDDGDTTGSTQLRMVNPVYFIAVCAGATVTLPKISTTLHFPSNTDLVQHYVGFARWAKAVDKTLLERDQDLIRSQARVAELEQSICWRIRQPLRRVVDLARQTRSRVGAARRLWRRGVASLPMVWRILRTEGSTALARRIQDKLNAPRYIAPKRPAPALSQIGPLALATCADSLVPRYSIVIPVYEQHLFTFNCLKSLGEHTDLSDAEIIVVDDSSPTTVAATLPNVTGVRLVRNPENLGFIGSCHQGADLARGQMLVMLNNDTQVTQGWLTALQAVFDQQPETGLVGARLVYPDGSLQEAGGIVWQDGSAWNWGRGDDPDRPIYNYLREADYCSGACVAIRRDDWVALGGFDRAYKPAYYEDTDLAFRVRAAGKRVYYQPQCTIVHFEGASSGTDETAGVKRHQVVNREVFQNRWKAALQSHRLNGVDASREVDRGATARVLVVEACMITPDHDSGSVRMLSMLELLVEQGCKVSFVADNLEYRQPYVRQLQGIGVEVWFAPFVTSVTQLLKERGKLYDTIIFCRFYIAAPYVSDVRKWAPQARIVFDTVDLHYLREQRLAELDNSSALLATSVKTREKELGVVKACDITLVVSPFERDILLEELPAADVRVLSNIHEVQPSGPDFAQRDGLLFIGGFRHLPNVDAIEWFVTEVWPLVRARLPALTLTVVGSLMPDRIKAINGPGINNLGYVAKVESLIARARISVAPLRYGAGVKGKVNQAMAHGLPVVATSVAAEGMGLRPGIDLLVADEPIAFANAIVRLHGDEVLWQSLAENGRANVEHHFSRANASEVLVRLVGLRDAAA